MAITNLWSLDAGEFATDGITASVGSPAYSTSIVRTGTRSIRFNPGSGAQSRITVTGASAQWWHFGFYVATMPTAQRLIAGHSPDDTSLRLESDGHLTYYNAATLVGTSSTILVTGRWYWIGMRRDLGTSVVFVQIDGIDEISGTIATASTDSFLGPGGTEASAIDCYMDDIIIDDAGFLAPSKVALMLPTADSAVGTGWTLGTGTAISSNGFAAVDNTPPVGVADLAAGSNPKQIRNAASAANSNYDATMQTYTALGIAAADTLLAVRPVVATAAPVSTSAKQGTIGVSSNPVIANIALGAGGTSGAFWSGVAGGTYPTGWKVSFGTLTLSPSVTLGTAPVIRVTQVTSSTRIAVVCFLGLLVAWTPVVVPPIPYTSPYPPLIAQ